VPPDLAELVFEVQEQLDELRLARQGHRGDERTRILALSAKRASLQGLMDELYAELIENFAAFDTGGGPDPDGLFAELRTILSKIAYLKTLLRDVDRELQETTE
jgi:hypothetical protein